MYKYEYEKISYDLNGWRAFGGNVYSIDSYKEITEKLGDIICGNRGNSCAKELSKAVQSEYLKSKQPI